MEQDPETIRQFIRERLEDPDSLKAAALAWLEGGGGRNTLGELDDASASIAFVQEAYAAGAPEVLAIEIDDYGDDGQNTGKLLVGLPSDSSRRAGVFRWHAEQAARVGFDPEPDVGQTHLFMMLD